VIVGYGGDPRGAIVGLRRDRIGEFRVALKVIGALAHPAREFFGGEQPLAAFLRSDDELDRGGPVRIEDDDRAVVESVEDLAPKLVQSGHQGAVLAIVQLAPHLFGQCDRRDVCEQPRANYLAHQRASSPIECGCVFQPLGEKTAQLQADRPATGPRTLDLPQPLS
jgi:hypothetical protein